MGAYLDDKVLAIISDIEMPRMDGIEALKEIRKIEEEAGLTRESQARVIITSADSEAETILSAYDSTCEAYLVKPFGWKRLQETLARLGFSE